MDIEIFITAQAKFRETNTPVKHVTFSLTLQDDVLFEINRNVFKSLLIDLVNKQTDVNVYYEYVHHEFRFGDKIKLNSDKFKSVALRAIAKQNILAKIN